MNEEFYIGYLNKYPKKLARFIKIILASLILMIAVIAWILASQQRGFIESTYEYYHETEITGFLISEPVPAIQIPLGTSVAGEQLLKTIPIVQFGKIGGAPLAREFDGEWVTAKGFLIYYDGRTLIEISNPENLILTKDKPNMTSKPATRAEEKMEGTFQGEILDAKCYFGVMKPGHGKPHRSCAIRCISGGIPAVLHSKDPSGQVKYYLLNTTDFDMDRLLKFVGEPVVIQGEESRFHDWIILTINELAPKPM
jgi:hypothetical protein